MSEIDDILMGGEPGPAERPMPGGPGGPGGDPRPRAGDVSRDGGDDDDLEELEVQRMTTGDDDTGPTTGTPLSGKGPGTISSDGGDDDDLEELEVQRMTTGDDDTGPTTDTPLSGKGPGTISSDGGDDDDLEELEVQRFTIDGDSKGMRDDSDLLTADATASTFDTAAFDADAQRFDGSTELPRPDEVGDHEVEEDDGRGDDLG